MDTDQQLDYWREGSEKDWQTVERMVKGEDDLHWALFIMHLSVEKALKALFVKTNAARPPFTHNLRRLAELTGLRINESDLLALEQANVFNLEGRYPEEKMEIYKRATPEYTKEWKERLGRIRRWILDQL